MLLAANITELDIVIPPQPRWTDEDIAGIKTKSGSKLTRGSALAWLGHLNTLRWFLSTELETLLVLEDDVDWDIHLRTRQVPRVAATIRHLLKNRPAVNSTSRARQVDPTQDPDGMGGYWGSPEDWDILYLGHCGDAFKAGKWNFRIPRASFYDPTLPPRQSLEKKTRKLLRSIALPEDVRVVHQSIQPLCTFGIALTRSAAHRILHKIAQKEPKGGAAAYDVRILEACRDKGFRCWSSTPELFHHVHLESEIAIVNNATTTTSSHKMRPTGFTKSGKKFLDDEGDDDDDEDEDEEATEYGDKNIEEAEMAAVTQEQRSKQIPMDGGSKPKKKMKVKHRKAPNIACGARWFKVEDEAELKRLQKIVGREGNCIAQPQSRR